MNLAASRWNTFPTHKHTHRRTWVCVSVGWFESCCWLQGSARRRLEASDGTLRWRKSRYCSKTDGAVLAIRGPLVAWHDPKLLFRHVASLALPPATLWPRSNPAGLTYFYLQLFLNTDFACVVSHIESITSTANVYTQIAFCWSE